MTRKMLTIAVAMVAVVAFSGCEPAMKITAKTPRHPLAASTSYVEGTVSPAKATPRVYLQRTVGGKWVDWKACPAVGCGADKPKVPVANVDQKTGKYRMAFPVPWCGTVLHLRVRSAGETEFSPGFYLEANPYESC